MTPLHHWGDWVRHCLELVPMGAVRWLFVATIAALLIWVLCLPKTQTRPPGEETGSWGTNLKWWAALALLIQLLIYLLV